MASHEFGIMQKAPKAGKRYDAYEPQKYGCISVDDTYIEDVAARLADIDFYWHTVDVAGKGLAYCGITLIPPVSAKAVLSVIENAEGLDLLCALFQTAIAENKWIIHYGL